MNENENIFDNTLNNSVIDENASNNQQPVAPVQEQPAQEVVQPAPVEQPAQEVVQPAPAEQPAQEVVQPSPVEQPTQEINNTINPQQQILDQLNTQQSNEGSVQSDIKPPKKKGKWLIIVLVLIIIGAIGYVVYDKFISGTSITTKTNDTDTASSTTENESKVLEFVSLDSNSSLKLEDGNYELKVKNYNGESINESGSYTEENGNYLLDNNRSIIVNSKYVEVTNLEDENLVFYNVILFKKDEIKKIKDKIGDNVVTYVESLKSNCKNCAEVEKVESNFDTCFRYAYNSADSNQEYIKCSISYDVYLKDYNLNECKNDKGYDDSKYIGYMIPAGECLENYIRSGKFFTLDQNNDFKVIDTFTGL